MGIASALRIAVRGMLAFAVGIGIGRFAFTPLLPLMQRDAGLTLSTAAWLASANYLGYLAGALAAIWIRLPGVTMLRGALIAIVALTAAMGAAHDVVVWLALRALAGVASAWALIFASATILPQLSATAEQRLSGLAFAGVGLGIVLAGAACLLAAGLGWSSSEIWWLLGALGLSLAVFAWPRSDATAKTAAALPRAAPRAGSGTRARLAIVLCYGAFGLAYIVPATFLPAMARHVIANPAIFGWAWPVFGLAALASTLVAARLSAVLSNRRIWIIGNIVMAAGLAAPLVWTGIGGIILSAVCVGGTFMVVTLAGLQEAQRIAPGSTARPIAAMTTAFATGQVVGPLLVGTLDGKRFGMEASLLGAALLLVVSAAALWREKQSSDDLGEIRMAETR